MTSFWYPQQHELEAPRPPDAGGFAATLARALGGVASAALAARVAAAVAAGERDPARLTDLVFNLRHPERGGRRIAPGERALAQEWLFIRDRAVIPALRALATAPAAPPPPVIAPPSPFTKLPNASRLLTPPRTHVGVTPLFPGDRALEAQLKLIRTVATRRDGFVYLCNWYAGISPQPPTLMEFAHVLRRCAQAGGTIRALFWDGTMHKVQNEIRRLLGPASVIGGPLVTGLIQREINAYIVGKTNHDVNLRTARLINDWCKPNGVALLDDDTLPFGSHHQKFFVAGNSREIVAIVGGVDLHVNRIQTTSEAGTPYFDISIQVDGDAAADLADLFARRWNADYRRRFIQLPSHPRPPARTSGGATVQIGPNFGCGSPIGDIKYPIHSGAILIMNMLSKCRGYFYAEDQYGVGNSYLLSALQQAFKNGARYGVVVLANADVNSDLPEIHYHRWAFWTKFPQLDRQLFVFERLGDNFDGKVGPHAYVHSKLFVVDDLAATIGSMNMNRRSWFYDSELTALVTDAPELIRDMRLGIWRAHLKPSPSTDIAHAEIADWTRAGAVWSAVHAGSRAAPRLRRVRFDRQPGRASSQFGARDFLYDNVYDPTGPPSC
jgi:hypothetical protein